MVGFVVRIVLIGIIIELLLSVCLSGHAFFDSHAVWDEYHLDQEINDRGIRVDMPFVKQCIDLDAETRDSLTTSMRELTELDNPNSVAQMKTWLSDNGVETDTLGKKAVAALIGETDGNVSEALLLRQQLAKSSVKKYQAMENAACADGRCRGMFQFYGANRTGRFAGRLVQLQNLPQNHMLFITLPSCRNLVYVKPRIGENRFGGESVTYEGVGGTKKWERIESYGPKFVENIVQATARDILMYAMKTLRCCEIVAHVHDEIIIEADPRMSLDVLCEQMGRVPPWAEGLLLRADGYVCDFYKKD